MHNLDVGSFIIDHSMYEKDLMYQFMGLHLNNHQPKDMPMIKNILKTIFRSTKVIQSQIIFITCFLLIRYTLNQNSQCHEDTSIHKQNHILSSKNFPLLQEMNFLPSCRARICTGVNAYMPGGPMINAVPNYGMSLGIIKQSCADNIIVQKKKQNI